MRFRGEALDRDTVLVWTGDRELTQFSRDGTRASFTLPFTPVAGRIDGATVVAVDERGTVHRFSRTGEPLGFVPLPEAPDRITGAAIHGDGALVAILAGEVQVYAYGRLRPWSFEHRRADGWRETGVDISGDGRALLVHYATTGSGDNLADTVEGFSITRDDGLIMYRHFARHLAPLEIAMSPDARRIAICEDASYVRLAETPSMAPLHRIEPVGRVSCMRFDDARLGVLYDYQLVIVDGGETRLELPEQFDDFVFSGDEVVCVHPELGAWWIKTAAAG